MARAVAARAFLAVVAAAVIALPAGQPAPTSAQQACNPLRELHGFQIFDVDADLSGGQFETVHGTASPHVYRLDLPSDEFRERGDSPDFVCYERFSAQAGDWRVAASLRLSRTHRTPLNLSEDFERQVSEALFLPTPGVTVRQSDFNPQITAHWIEPAGHYELQVDPRQTDLTIEQVAATIRRSPAVELGPYPPGTRIGIAAVDRVLSATQAKDVPALSALVVYEMVPCGRVVIGWSPSCPEGVEPGTPVEALAASCFEPAFWTRGSESDGVLQQVVDEAEHLFAVLELEFEGQALGYQVIFAESAFGGSAWSIHVQDGQVRSIQTPCLESAPSRASQGGDPVLPMRLAPGAPVVGTGLAPEPDTDRWGAIVAVLALVGFVGLLRQRRRCTVHRW